MLARLEKAIRELEVQKESLLEVIQKWGWQDNRTYERTPERLERTPEPGLIDVFAPTLVPEQAPLPPGVRRSYQEWYSAGRVILARNQSDRLAEFDGVYSHVTTILRKRHLTQDEQFNLMDLIDSQFDILAALPSHLRFAKYDIELEAYSVLMDDELVAAQHLASRGFLRPAGVLAGVILERHLKNLLRKHTPPIKFRKNAALASLNDWCKDSIYDLVTWRKVQHLADVRNLCAHHKSRELTKDEITELIGGVSALLKTQNV